MADLGRDDRSQYEYLAEGNARQARKRVAAKVVVRDLNGHVLVVNPTYKEFWDIPGGMANGNEAPSRAAARELREELGIDVEILRLLAIKWVGPRDPWDDQIVFVFDGGVMPGSELARMHLADSELSDFAFLRFDQAYALLRPDVGELLTRAFESLTSGETYYDENA